MWKINISEISQEIIQIAEMCDWWMDIVPIERLTIKQVKAVESIIWWPIWTLESSVIFWELCEITLDVIKSFNKVFLKIVTPRDVFWRCYINNNELSANNSY